MKLPWAKGLVVEDWIIHSVQCMMCSLIENKENIVGCKWDTLTKHIGCRIAVHGLLWLGVKKGGKYIVKDYAHSKNIRLWAQRDSDFVLQQLVNKPLEERNWKMVNFESLFRIFMHGCPMLGYETIYELFVNSKVFNNLTIQWLDFASWTLLNLCTSKSIMPLSKPYNMSSS